MTLGEKRVDWAGLKPAPLAVWASALTVLDHQATCFSPLSSSSLKALWSGLRDLDLCTAIYSLTIF